MSDTHSFELRRLATDGGGDSLQQGIHPLRFSATPVSVSTGKMVAKPVGYDGIDLVWTNDFEPYGLTQVALVRSSFGYPEHPDDGMTVLMKRIGTGISSFPTDASDGTSFRANPYYGVAPLSVSFDATNLSTDDRPILSYEWDFGTGTEAVYGDTASYIYENDGTYTASVTITVSDGAGGFTQSTKTRTIIATAPIASATEDRPFQDRGLSSGKWYYYTLMIRYGTSNPWTKAYTARALVPYDFAHRDQLYNRLPEFYRKRDEQDWAGTPNSTLRNFFWGIGYDLDLTRTLTEGIQEVWNPDTAPMELLRMLGTQNLGVLDAEELGDIRFRGVVSDHLEINGRRGTMEGARRFIAAASKYATEMTPGLNMMLLVDDAEFIDSVGHWAPAPYTIVKALVGSPLDTSAVKITPVPAGELIDFPSGDY